MVDSRLSQKIALAGGDLSRLSPAERGRYYIEVCNSLRLNPVTQPFSFVNLNGKLCLYAKKEASDQLRESRDISIRVIDQKVVEGIYVVTVEAKMPDGRTDIDIGAVFIDRLSGDIRANAMMKAFTKAKRRVTLSICGLGGLDETEIETIPGAEKVDLETGEIIFSEESKINAAENMNDKDHDKKLMSPAQHRAIEAMLENQWKLNQEDREQFKQFLASLDPPRIMPDEDGLLHLTGPSGLTMRQASKILENRERFHKSFIRWQKKREIESMIDSQNFQETEEVPIEREPGEEG